MQYIFGDYTLDTSRHELLCDDSPVKLRPKVFQVLAHLVVHRERMVPKDELLETIWPRVVGEEVLNSCIMAARRAVGDDGRTQRIIKTTHGVGYRFVAEVRQRDQEMDGVLPSEQLPTADEGQAAGSTVNPPATVAPEPRAPPIAATGPATEHKTVTVLACAVAQAEDLAERLGPEAMYELMQAFFSLARAVMDRHEGTIVQWSGDGFLALFGAPVAHEDDSRRAVLASLELNELIQGQGSTPDNPRTGADYSVSMGLHTGPIVVGALEESSASQTYTARGRTTDMATQLQSRAPPGAILISDSTYRLVETEVKARPLNGPTGPTPAYLLSGITKRHAGVPKRSNRQISRFVGRNEELAILRERLTRVENKQSQVISIIGAPGIGKSRLLNEFRIGQPTAKVTFLEGQCLPYGTGTPYLPLQDLVKALCGIDDVHDPEHATEQVHSFLLRMDATEETECLLLDLLGIPIKNERLSRLSPQARRARTFALLQQLLFGAAAVCPTVVIIEDLHWVDATSEEWLGDFIAHLGDAAILLLLTYRSPYSPDWLGRSAATQLALPPLNSSDSTILIQSNLRQHKVPQETTGDILAKADGNPFFLEELTYSLGVDPGMNRSIPIPNTVQAVLAARIDQLDPAGKQLLQVCSAIGSIVSYDLLQQVAGYDAETLEETLRKLGTGEFLFEVRGSPQRTYRFRHALTQEVTYSGLPQTSREDLHSRIAAALECHFKHIADGKPEVLARHHSCAGNAEAAVNYWQRAGRRAYVRSAYTEAINYTSKGLEVLDSSESKENRAERELSLQLTLAPALTVSRGYGAPEVEHAYARARDLCEKIGDTQQIFRTHVGLWNFYWVHGELDTAREVAEKLINFAEQEKDSARRLRAHAAMGEVLFHLGELEESEIHLRRGIELYEIESHHSFATQAPQVGCLCYAAWALWHLGHSDQSLVRAEKAISLANELSHPLSRALSLTLKAELHQFRLEVEECRVLAEQAIILCQEQRFPFWEGTAMVLYGWAQALAGDFDSGRQMLEDGLKIFNGTGARVQRTPWLGMLAEIHGHVGNFEKGLTVLEEAFDWVGRTGEQHYHSELHRVRGDLLLAQNSGINTNDAESSLSAALDIARRQGAKMRELRASVSLAQLWRDQGRTEEAVALMEPAQAWFESAIDSVDVKKARTLLKSLST